MSQYPSSQQPRYPVQPPAPATERGGAFGVASLASGVAVVVTGLAQQVSLHSQLAGGAGGAGLLASQSVFGLVALVLALAATGLGIAGAVGRGGNRLAAGIGLGIGASALIAALGNVLLGLAYG